MTRQEKKEELIGLFTVGAIFIGDLIDECIEYGQQQPQWISVADRIPKLKHSYDNMKYTDTVIVTNGKYCTSANWRYYKRSGWYGWYDDEDEELKGITHWMPLPKMPILSKSGNIGKKGGEHIIGTAEHIKIAMDVIDKEGGEK